MIVPKINKRDTALIIVDKQKGYFDKNLDFLTTIGQKSNSLELVSRKIDEFILFARKVGLPILWVRMIENINHSSPSIVSKMKELNKIMPSTIDSITSPGKPSFDYFGSVTPITGESEAVKSHYSFLPNKDVELFLRNYADVKNLIFVGGYTSRCILGSVFSANIYNYVSIVGEDMVGYPDKDKEEHQLALRLMRASLGYVLDSKILKELL